MTTFRSYLSTPSVVIGLNFESNSGSGRGRGDDGHEPEGVAVRLYGEFIACNLSLRLRI